MNQADIAEKLHQANLLHIAKKLKAGQSLTKAEADLLAKSRALEGQFVPSAEALADRIGCARKTITRWSKESSFPAKTAQGYDVKAVQVWVDANGKKASRSKDLQDEERQEKIELLRVKKDVLLGRYVTRDEVATELGRLIYSFKLALQRRANELAPRLVGMTVVQALDELKKSDHALLKKLSESPWATPPAKPPVKQKDSQEE